MIDLKDFHYRPLYISDLQKDIEALSGDMKQQVILYLTVNREKQYRSLEVTMPSGDILASNIPLYGNYLLAMVNNLIISFGGVSLDFYYDKEDIILSEMIEGIIKKFNLESPNNYRKGYGVYINYINRMNSFLGNDRFRMDTCDLSEYSCPDESKEYRIYDAKDIEAQVKLLKRAATELHGKCFCSLDIGGNSIKGAIVRDGEIEILKELQWCPTAFKVADEIIRPILLMLEFLKTALAYKDKGNNLDNLKDAFKPSADLDTISRAIENMKMDMPSQVKSFDAIVMGFPDIVVNNKVAGGESYKQLGMRNNPDTEYEEEFIKTSGLDELAREYVKEDGIVCVLNDGNAASFVISVEQAFVDEDIIGENGMLAHTIGTEMGTGFISRVGTIQEIPLECYQYIIDLGSINAWQYPPGDIRSINNLNTGIPGTVQKYVSQLGLFRVAIAQIYNNNRPMFDRLVESGLLEYSEDGSLLFVPMATIDRRSELTRYLIGLLDGDNEDVKYAFKTMGKALGVLMDQTKIIFPELPTTRLISGGLVACDAAYRVICQGLKEHNDEYKILRLDENTVVSPLLKKMRPEERNFNVAIGSAYIANKILIESRLKEK